MDLCSIRMPAQIHVSCFSSKPVFCLCGCVPARIREFFFLQRLFCLFAAIFVKKMDHLIEIQHPVQINQWIIFIFLFLFYKTCFVFVFLFVRNIFQVNRGQEYPTARMQELIDGKNCKKGECVTGPAGERYCKKTGLSSLTSITLSLTLPSLVKEISTELSLS